MAKFVNPTTADFESAPEIAVSKGLPASPGLRNPTLVDMGMGAPKQKREVPFGGGTMKFGPWDTGVELSPEADKFLSGFGKSFSDVPLSLRQMLEKPALASRGSTPVQREVANKFELDEPLMDTGWGTAGDIIGSVAMTAPIPVGAGSKMLGKGVGTFAPRLGAKISKSLLTDAAIMGGLSAQLKPVQEGETRLGNTAVGAGAGALGYAVMKPAMDIIGKGINFARNKWGDYNAQQLDEVAKRYGVDLSVGDLTRSPAWQMFEDASQDVPLSGRRQIMERQTGQIQDLLHSLRENVRPDLDVVDAAGNAVAKYSTPDEMMVGELQRNFANLTKQKDALFDNVSTVIANSPNAKPVVFNNTRKQIAEILDSHPQIFDKFRDMDSRLMNTLAGLDDNLSTAQGVLNAQGQPFQRTAQGTYQEAQWLRQRLGQIQAAAAKQARTGTITDDMAGQLKQLYKAVNQDLDSWGAKPGNTDVHKAYKEAQKFYQDNIVPFKQHAVLKKVVSEHQPYDHDVAMKEFFKEGRENLARDIMKFQTPEGQKAAQFVVLEDMITRGLNKNKESGLDIQAFLNRSGQLDMPNRHVLSPEVKQQVSDVEDILRAAKRSAGYLDSGGNTGRYAAVQAARATAPYLIGGGAMATGAAAGTAPATAGVLAGLLGITRAVNSAGSSPIGKRALMASTRLPGPLQDVAELFATRYGAPAGLDWRAGAALPPYVDDFRYPLSDNEEWRE